MHRVLFISDDQRGKRALTSDLREQGYSVVQATSADAMREDFSPGHVELIVADLERCATEDEALCRALRRDRPFKELPLVLLVPEERLGQIDFKVGVDDYLTLPVSPKRLTERIRFLVWKLQRAEPANGFSRGKLVVDFDRYEVHVNGDPVDLTYKEFELLRFLATHPGRVFTREVLLDKVWGYDYYGGTRTVDVHVRRLRAKIETGGATYLETVRNVGYKFLGPSEQTS